MAKAGACQKMETLAVVAKELYPKTGIIEFPEEVTLEDISNAEKWALED